MHLFSLCVDLGYWEVKSFSLPQRDQGRNKSTANMTKGFMYQSFSFPFMKTETAITELYSWILGYQF